MNIQSEMNEITEKVFPEERTNILAYYPNIEIDAAAIKIVMINEIVADAPVNDFYSPEERSFYMETTIPLFQQAGIDVQTIEDIVTLGIYITNAVKRPKTETAISTNQVKEFLPLLEKELQLFPNLKAVMLNGDIAKKAFNMLSKQQTGKNAVPSMSTYKLRNREVYADQLRIFPAYIMTGKNVLIEKSKVQMTAEDIAKMIAYAQ
ncbi:uracil-DNA glycosylase family protein [Enterococcus larvae]|uniref:uracil-DNA glycosylase family protein n=1 Tax=Enterococcus larvae TaxID=2794352 RepID=UPI003F3A8DFD